MIVEEALDLRFELPDVHRLLVADPNRLAEIAEAPPVPLHLGDLPLVKHVEDLLRRQRDVQAAREGAQSPVEVLPDGFVGQETAPSLPCPSCS